MTNLTTTLRVVRELADAHPCDRWAVDGQTYWMTGEECPQCGAPMATQGRIDHCTAGCEGAGSGSEGEGS